MTTRPTRDDRAEDAVRFAATSPGRGMLVSIEGISGSGKTHMANLLRTGGDPAPPAAVTGHPPTRRSELGQALLEALAHDPRGTGADPRDCGASAALLVLAAEMSDYERDVPGVLRGEDAVDDHGIFSTVVYQALAMHAPSATRDDEVLSDARVLLDLAFSWRMRPDLTIVLVDDVDRCVARVRRREGRPLAEAERDTHHRAAALLTGIREEWALRARVLDMRVTDMDEAVRSARRWMRECREDLPPLLEPWRSAPA